MDVDEEIDVEKVDFPSTSTSEPIGMELEATNEADMSSQLSDVSSTSFSSSTTEEGNSFTTITTTTAIAVTSTCVSTTGSGELEAKSFSSTPRASSPEKKVINLSPIAISNMFKNPGKGGSDSAVAVAGKVTIVEGSKSKAVPKSDSAQLNLSQAIASVTSALKKKVFCANTNCNAKTDTVFEASAHAKLYFGMKTSNSPKICLQCYKKAEHFHQTSKALIKNKKNLFDLKCQIQTTSSDAVVDLDSPGNSPHVSDDEDTKEPDDLELYSVSMDKINVVLAETMKKYDIQTQVKNCTETVSNEVEDLACQFSKLELDLDDLRSKIEGATKTYNDNIATQSKIVEIGSVNIDSHGSISVKKAEVNCVDELGRLEQKALNKAVDELQSMGKKGVGNVNVQQYPKTIPVPPPQIPPQNPIGRRMPKLIFVKPKEGQDVYAMHKHCLFYWLPAKILKVVLSISSNRPTIYTVRFQQRVKLRGKPGLVDDTDAFIKELTGKQLAFKKPSTVTLPVGTRIIAKFKDLLKTDVDVDGMYYAGIVAEVPKSLNKFRYLVFFDDGYAQYVHPTEVLPVVESSTDVWCDVHRNSQDFIQEYVSKFPDRHMIRAEIGATFNVELKGNWLQARIMEVDGSLMKVQFLGKTDGLPYEWIYRGSTRLGPLFSRLKSLEAKPTVTVARRHTYSSRKTNFSFEMNRDCEDEDGQSKVAKKQVSDPPPAARNGGVIRAKNGVIISTVLESEGNMIKIQIPVDCPSPRQLVNHNCSPKCAYRYENDKYRKVSPTAIPFYLGWARELAGVNRDTIFYHTPCGVRLGTYEQIHAYITRTECKIPIDFFSIEPNIDCLNEFEPSRRIEYLKDISYGKEWTPVSCVNSLDHELPAYMEYITARVPGVGVEINDDDEFLTCCDCEDDCQDASKCKCLQQTFAGISFKIAKQEGENLTGYQFRRLKSHVLSGIYECNRKCRCRSTCFNRVVQNPVKWPIQMFKTVAKGWGVRALHDMPAGSFICVYTGRLLTDAGANEAGIEEGDEYLAELDFIECNEQMKEEYESDCTDIECEEPGTRSNARLARQISNEEKSSSQPKKQEVAKKSTIQKAVKSTSGRTGGRKSDHLDDCDRMSTISNASTEICGPSSATTNRPVARKSGSRNGTLSKTNGQNPTGGGETSTSAYSVPSPASTLSVKSGDSDDDDDIQIYSSFSASTAAKNNKNAPRLPLREYFGKDESVYIMDAKSKGNFGRYLNHSCEPNVFVQNVFVDTHDLRFPWVAFFTKKDVKAGTELTWDYNYEIGSVPGKTLYCYCLQQECRGRLL